MAINLEQAYQDRTKQYFELKHLHATSMSPEVAEKLKKRIMFAYLGS